MKLPRNLTGAQLIKALQQLGYQATRQTGSHVRLTCRLLPNPVEATSHSTKLAKNTSQVAGYLPQAGEGANESLREFHVTPKEKPRLS